MSLIKGETLIRLILDFSRNQRENKTGKDARKPTRKTNDEKQDISSRYKHCEKPDHNIPVCFRPVADQAAAKSDGPLIKNKSTKLSAAAIDLVINRGITLTLRSPEVEEGRLLASNAYISSLSCATKITTICVF